MTLEQEQHIQNIIATFVTEAYKKYRKGAEEHGGDLQAYAASKLCEEIMAEAIDSYVYAHTLLEKLKCQK